MRQPNFCFLSKGSIQIVTIQVDRLKAEGFEGGQSDIIIQHFVRMSDKQQSSGYIPE